MDEELYSKVKTFLEERGRENLIASFKIDRIDDKVASKVSDEVLRNIGLVTGDIISFRETFPDKKKDSEKTYGERAAELKEKLKMKHPRMKDKLNRAIIVNKLYPITISLKCHEKGRYTLKAKKGTILHLDPDLKYDEYHEKCRNFFKIKVSSTYVGNYKGSSFDMDATIKDIVQQSKETKHQITLYLYYPYSYDTLMLEKNENSDTPFKVCEDCGQSYLRLCFECAYRRESAKIAEDQNAAITQYTTVSENVNIAPNVPVSSTRVSSRESLEVCGSCFRSKSINEDCITCQQNNEFNLSLEVDCKKTKCDSPIDNNDVLNDVSVSENTPPSLTAVRQKRINRFHTKKPIRFLHSPGSPSLSLVKPKFTVTETPSLGDCEVKSFLNKKKKDEHIIEESIVEDEVNDADFFSSIRSSFDNNSRKEITVIVQRDDSKFWDVLFAQPFDLVKHKLKIRFGGECGLDTGGLLREFLTMSMSKITNLTSLFIGAENNVCFNLNTDSIINKNYFQLGQLCGLAILEIGKGPECFHPAVVSAIFNRDIEKIYKIDDSYGEHLLKKIEDGNNEPLFDLNINPIGKTFDELKQQFLVTKYIFNNFNAIDQFRQGLSNVSPEFLSPVNYFFVKRYLQQREIICSFDDIVSLFNYPHSTLLDAASNAWSQVQSSIVEFELFLATIESGNIDNNSVDFAKIIHFFTGSDRIPPFGFHKKIDISFTDVSMPTASTCGLNGEIPFTDIKNKFILAVKFGGGFGKV